MSFAWRLECCVKDLSYAELTPASKGSLVPSITSSYDR
jgi:hypothetical protein